MTTNGWREVRRIASVDGKRELHIMQGPHGMFRFDELRWTDGREDDLDDGYWYCEHFSGLYDSAARAEEDARSSVPWLRDEKRN